MDPLLQFLDKSAGASLLVLGALVVFLCVLAVVQWAGMRSMKARWAQMLNGADGRNIERLLYDHLKQRVAVEEELDLAKKRLSELEAKMKTSKRFVGLVRYDAFQDVGGGQSFALAIYDDEGNGAVVTSQVGREACRVYGKPLVAGKAERALTAEEQAAISKAFEPPSREKVAT